MSSDEEVKGSDEEGEVKARDEGQVACLEALRDLYGPSPNVHSFEEGEAMLASARKQLDEALQLLPSDDGLRDAYDQAMKNAPYLVEMESNPVLFLRSCNFDPWAAARRICTYWKIRKDIFGDRAFLPMKISGEGALSADDAEALKCGAVAELPPDINGRPVMLSDRSKICVRCLDEKTRAKVFFYIVQCLVDNDNAVKNGFVGVLPMDTQSQNFSGRNTPAARVLRMFTGDVFPIQMKAIHLVVVRKRSILEMSIPSWLNLFELNSFMHRRTVVHYAESKDAVLTDLKQYGILEEGLPKELGGNYDQKEGFLRWCSERSELELQRYRKVEEPLHNGTVSHEAPEAPNALEDLAAVADRARIEEAKARKRKLDAIYQRNKREHERSHVLRLREQSNALLKENASLKAEEQSLKEFLDKSIKIVENSRYEQQKAQLTVGGIATSFVQNPTRASLPGASSLTSYLHHLQPFHGSPIPLPISSVVPGSANLDGGGGLALNLLQRLRASGAHANQDNLEQQIQAQQQLALRQQLERQQQAQAQLASILLGNSQTRADYMLANLNPALASPVTTTILDYQRSSVSDTQQMGLQNDTLESLLRRTRS